MKRVSRKLFEYPASPPGDVVESYHGTAVADPYRWLEEPDAPQTKAWVAAQNVFTRAYLDEIPRRAAWTERLTELWNFPKWSAPRHRGSRHFYQYNDGLQNQPVLYVGEEDSDTPRVLLDPNRLTEHGTQAITTFTPSKDGRFLAYNLSQSGSDWQTVHVLDVDSGQPLADRLDWCKFTQAAWLPDNSGFFYSRYPSPEEMPDAPPSTHNHVYFHRLGTPQSEDSLIYARPDAPNLGFAPRITDDGRYLLLHVWDGTDRRNRFYYRELASDGDFVRLLDEMDAGYQFLGNDDTLFYFQTDLKAPNGRFIAIDISHPARDRWQELIPEADDTVAFSRLIHNQFVVVRLHHAHHQLHLYALDGTAEATIELPTLGTIFDLTGQRDDSEMFLHFYSFLYPPTILRYTFANDKLHIHHQPQLDFDPDAYETTQAFVTSKDGTRVPLFLTHRKGLTLDGSHPTLLYGYGGFNISLTPLFSPTRLAWIERGGVYAQACLRGGSEYGEAWHQAGMLANKQNVFDDFMAAAEWLVESGYTRNGRLAIEGRSNGGLLVAACVTQRPELFGAVHCGVPVIDMLRYHRFTAGRYWTAEYGNAVENADDFAFMMGYSPLHNVKGGVSYPPTLITTADTDDRVVPMHAMKFAATLQTADPGHNPLLIRIETEAGHGLGKPTTKLIEEASDVYSFLWHQLMNQ